MTRAGTGGCGLEWTMSNNHKETKSTYIMNHTDYSHEQGMIVGCDELVLYGKLMVSSNLLVHNFKSERE